MEDLILRILRLIGGRQTDRQTDRQKTQTDRHRQTDTDKQTDRKKRQADTDRLTDLCHKQRNVGALISILCLRTLLCQQISKTPCDSKHFQRLTEKTIFVSRNSAISVRPACSAQSQGVCPVLFSTKSEAP